MRRAHLLLAFVFATAVAPLAAADVPSPGKCKCSLAGAPEGGALAAGILGGGALLLLGVRRRRR